MRPIPKFLLLIFAAVLLSCQTGSQILHAQEKPIGRKVTLDLQDVSLLDALKQVCLQAHVRYRVAPELMPVLTQERRTLHVENNDLDSILYGLLTATPKVRMTHSYVSDEKTKEKIVVIYLDAEVSLDIEKISPAEALSQLLAQSGYDFVFAAQALGEKPVSLHCERTPFLQALKQLLRQMETGKDLSYRFLQGVFVIERKGWKPETPQLIVTMQFDAVDIKTALEAILRACSTPYILPSLEALPITCDAKNQAFKICLETVLRKTGANSVPLTYTVSENIYTITAIDGTGQHVDSFSPPLSFRKEKEKP